MTTRDKQAIPLVQSKGHSVKGNCLRCGGDMVDYARPEAWAYSWQRCTKCGEHHTKRYLVSNPTKPSVDEFKRADAIRAIYTMTGINVSELIKGE